MKFIKELLNEMDVDFTVDGDSGEMTMEPAADDVVDSDVVDVVHDDAGEEGACSVDLDAELLSRLMSWAHSEATCDEEISEVVAKVQELVADHGSLTAEQFDEIVGSAAACGDDTVDADMGSEDAPISDEVDPAADVPVADENKVMEKAKVGKVKFGNKKMRKVKV